MINIKGLYLYTTDKLCKNLSTFFTVLIMSEIC